MPTRNNQHNTINALATTGTSTRRRRNRAPKVESSGDQITVRSTAIGSNCTFVNGVVQKRHYIPGNANSLGNYSGPTIASLYATGLFKPGTKIRWEPTISPTSGGRVFVGFTDNPEAMARLENAANAYFSDRTAAKYDDYSSLVKSLGNLISFPAWCEKDITFPLRTRRKRFDCNELIAFDDVNQLDRSCQQSLFMCADGLSGVTSGASIGSLWYYDVLNLEGLMGMQQT